MGALTINRKRGDEYYKSPTSTSPPIDQQSYGHISKKPKLSSSMSQKYSRQISSGSCVSKVSAYPDTKPSFTRVPHAPVRHFRFGSFTCFTNKFESSSKMGNTLGRYTNVKDAAMQSLRYFTKENGAFVEKKKVNEVIEIDDGEEIHDVSDDSGEDMQDVSDDSSIDEVDIVEWKARQKEAEMTENEFRSFDSFVVTDVSNAKGKVHDLEKMELVRLDQENDDIDLPMYKKLYESTMKRDGKLNNLKFDIELNEKQSQGYQSLRSQTKGKKVKKDWVQECFMPLTKEEESEVASAFSNSNRRKILVSHKNSNIDISVEKLQCLKPGTWLNDEVINVYLELLKEREKREPQKFLKCHFFNTFFYKKLIGGRGGYDFQAVKRWTTKRKLGYSLLECDKIFVPIHQQIHWCLAIINKKEEKIQYLDSLKGVDPQVLDVLAKYYVDEVKEKSGKEIDVASWELEYVRDLPEQENGYDCGMFMIKYADFYSRNLGLCFGQEHMPYFRRRTAKELLRLRAE